MFYNYNCKDYEFAVLPLPRLAYYMDFDLQLTFFGKERDDAVSV